MNWTKDQEDAILFRNKATIVSAAAGSGKTAVLVERVKRIIMNTSDPVPADKMVISTFTNDAAGELKARLAKAIDEELEKDPTNIYLEKQRIRLEDAYISTISSFALRILQRYSAQAGLQPGFRVIDAPEASLVFSQSLDAVLEDFCENGDPGERDMLYEWFADETDERIEKTLRTLYEFSRNIPDPDRYFSEQLAYYSDPGAASPEIKKRQDDNLKKTIAYRTKQFDNFIDELIPLTADTPAAELPSKWRGILDILRGVHDHSGLDKAYASLSAIEKLPSPPNKSKTFDNTAIKSVNDEFKKEFGEFLKVSSIMFRRSEDTRKCAPILKSLISLTYRLEKEFSGRKRDRNCVDFSDIELLTLRMLRDGNGEPSDIAKALAAEIKVIIVDEFQDSNDVQYEIFRLISDNKKNLYFVGDIKQSIYGFRGSDPLVFANLEKSGDFDVIRLNQNFRSCAEVIDSVNAIFRGTMTEELGDVNYDDTCALVQGKEYRTDRNNRTELLTFSGDNVTASRQAEAGYIAARIRKMVDEGFEVTEGDSKRPCRYGDFAVLGRYSDYSYYTAACEKAGIPFEAKSTDDFTDFTEVKHALALLRVIDDPYRDTDLAVVLMKEPYLLTAEEIASIKLAGGTKNKSLWEGLNKYAKTDRKAKQILDEINSYRSFAEENSAERLIRRICDESLLIPAAQAAPDGIKKTRNLRKLIHFAEKFTGGESASLYDFIKYMDNIKSSGIKLAQEKASAGSDAVRFMTIHGSKGLEFPICFVSNVTSKERAVSDELICDPRWGIGLQVSDTANMVRYDTYIYELVKQETLRRQRSEEMRLLYVAATRAKEKLIFTVPIPARNKPDMHYGWILNSSAVCVDPSARLIDVTNDPVIELHDTDSDLTDDTDEYVLPDFTEYGFKAFSAVPAKVTATQIGVKSAEDLSEERVKLNRFLRLPSFIAQNEEKRLSGKKRGDAYHKVMEKLDFGAAAEDVPDILGGLLSKGVLSELERDSVEEKDITAFLESGICRRAGASGEIYREYPIFCEYDGTELGPEDWGDEPKPFVQGIADMFFVENGEIVLVDYKTNRNTTKEKLIEEYKGQLEIYAGALEKATGLRVKQKLLYSFELGEIEIN